MITVNKEGARWVARFPFSYETKDVVKAAGFRFSAAEKLWYTTDPTVARRLDPMTAVQAVEEANAAIAQSRATNAAVAVPAPDGLAYLPYQLAGIAYAIAHNNVLIADEMGLGKGQPRTSHVLTPSGWEQIGDLRVGDEVIGSDGQPTTVTGVYPRGILPVYRVRFNDGASVLVDGDHLWAVRSGNQQYRNSPFQAKETRDLAKRLIDGAGSRIWRVPMLSSPVQFDSKSKLRIPPYIMGVLIGDGALAHHPTMFTPGDELVPAEVEKLLPEGFRLSSIDSPERATSYRIVNDPQSAPNAFLDAMRYYRLSGISSDQRFIPTSYLMASAEDRIALLQGLMDTDGELREDGHLEYTTASYCLAQNIAFLVEGLGGTARHRIKAEPKYMHNGEMLTGLPSYRVTINLPVNICPVRALAFRWTPREKYLPNRLIASIEPAGEDEVVCIAVDAPDHLYVTEHCLVTHNTIQAIGVVNATPAIKSVLVICPASLKINWAREMTKWLVQPRDIQIANGSFPQSDIVIINYDVLLKHRDAIMARQWDLIIIDECHYLKNTKAQRTKAIFGGKLQGTTLKPIPAKRRIFMTGTPIVNRPAELWSLVHALDPADLGGNFFRFMKRYTNARHNGYGWDFTGAANLSELQQRLRSKFMVRRLKKDVLKELPAKRRQILTVFGASAAAVVARELAVFEQRQAAVATAQAAVEKAEAARDQEAYKEAVARLKNMKQIDFAEMSKLRHETAVAKIPHVVEHVTEVLEAEEKVVVFVHHHDVAHALKAAFPTAAVVTGETTVGQRQLEVDRFQIDPACRVFIGSIKAAGLGLTLTAASHVVFAELDWVPGAVSQAEDRLHRIGQVNSVLVQHLVFDNSVDSRMAHMLVEKQNVIDAALDNPVKKVVLSEALASLI